MNHAIYPLPPILTLSLDVLAKLPKGKAGAR